LPRWIVVEVAGRIGDAHLGGVVGVHYRARCEIEMVFDVLKERLPVEALQLGSIAQLECALAQFMAMVWRIAYLMPVGRTCPDLNSELFFDVDEVHAACLLRNRVPPTKPR
jgi:hypothetical protein